ncbi:retrovirus-related pol polyprotein from transposon TNT 1-94 [Tanacetum coccineum]|uniref:Retrovirus-related pol polyprotein from transposon TNT 1-94 n=1 Tax=Tanacetum coccineum TaxID=301880 RepID=A0ABQ5E8X0_9ASTR
MEHLLGDAYLNENLKTLKPHHITASSFKPTLENEVPLTAHMCKVAKLSPEPIKSLIHSSEDVNTDDTADKSLSRTTVQKSIDEEFVKESGLESLGYIPLEEFGRADAELDITFLGPVYDEMDELVEETAESNLHSMPNDEVELISWFEVAHSKEKGTANTETKVTLIQSEEATADNILDELDDLKASADNPSDPLGYLRAKISSLSNKVDNLEFSLATKVSSKLAESVPRMVADAFEERMPELLSDTLKNILTNIIEESIQVAIPKFDKRIQETLQSTVPELVRKPLNKELNALNTLEIQRFASLQKELLTAIRAKIDKGDVNLWELINLMKDMVHLLDSASVFHKANAGGEKWEKANPVPDITDPNLQEEQPSVQETTSSEQTPPITEQVLPVSTALVVHASREKDSEEKVLEEEPPSKRLKFMIPNPITLSPNPLSIILPQNISLEQFTDSQFQTASSEYSLTPPRDENKGKGIDTKEDPVKLLMHLI